MLVAETSRIAQISCPSCGHRPLSPHVDNTAQCGRCGWTGYACLFSPLQREIPAQEAALPEDVTCVHHPAKKAVAICAGTGDYICSLCAIELGGKTYSTQYLDGPGKKEIATAFDRYLPRPDSELRLMALLFLIIPYLTVLLPLWVPYAGFKLYRAIQLRYADPLFRKVVRAGFLTFLVVILALEAGFGIMMIVVLSRWPPRM